MSCRVVITGIGVISALGLNVTDFWNALKAGQSAIRPLDPQVAGIKIRLGATIPDYLPEQYFSNEELTLLDRFSQLAVIAAREAITDAGLIDSEETLSQSGAVIGSGCGGKHTDEFTYDLLYRQNRSRVQPLTIPKGMPSAAASMVSTHLGIKGPVFSIASACASGAHSVIQGAIMIQSGLQNVVLAGATDAPFTYGLLKSWEALRVVSDDACRPFSANRSGMVLGEGAAMLVLESEEHAQERGADIYSYITGFGMTSDAGHITRPDVGSISKAISKTLANANVNPEDIDYINAHGTGTSANDTAETQAINNAFGIYAKKLAISSTKSMHGHALGASSALELAATALALEHGVIPPTANFTTADPECDLDYVPNTARDYPISKALTNSFAFGGLNAVIALSKHA